MRKRKYFISLIVMLTIIISLLAGCAGKEETLKDGSYQAELTMEGGTGKAHIETPVNIKVEDSKAYATLIWSSSNYDYMLVDGVKYINEASEGGSTFTIPVSNPPGEMTVIGDTTAMSVPHEIEYTLKFELIK